MSQQSDRPIPPLFVIRDSSLLDSVLELSDLLLVALDPGGNIRVFNRACERSTGFSAADVVGRSIFETLIPEDEIERVRRVADALATTGEASAYVNQWLTRDGRRRLIQWRNTAITDQTGQVEIIVGTGIDITDLDLARQREEDRAGLNQSLLTHATEGIVMVDAEGRVLSINPAAERILGSPAATILDQPIGEWLPDLDPGYPDGHLARQVAGGTPGSTGHDLTLNRPDGSRVDVQLIVAAVRDDGRRCYLGFLQDISERKHLEHQLRTHLQELAHLDRLGALSELTTGLAHEIAQPLTAVRSMAQACLTLLRSPDTDRAELEAALTRIVQQTTHAGEIITQLRAFLQRGETAEPQVVSVESLVDDVLQLLGHELRNADITLVRKHCEPPCELLVNRVQAEQVLANLIKNACEAMATVPGERILEVRGVRGSKGCEIEVADTGPGIAPEHLERIFEPFFSTKSSSLGQGLSICHSIVASHGGSLTAANRPEGGAVFRLRLPLAAPESACDDGQP